MNKNILKITTILCSLSGLPWMALSIGPSIQPTSTGATITGNNNKIDLSSTGDGNSSNGVSVTNTITISDADSGEIKSTIVIDGEVDQHGNWEADTTRTYADETYDQATASGVTNEAGNRESTSSDWSTGNTDS